MTEAKKSYRITDTAGDWVAGRRVPTVAKTRTVKDGDGKTEETVQVADPKFRIELTDRQAQYELLNGNIELDEPTPRAARAASDPADAGAA